MMRNLKNFSNLFYEHFDFFYLNYLFDYIHNIKYNIVFSVILSSNSINYEKTHKTLRYLIFLG